MLDVVSINSVTGKQESRKFTTEEKAERDARLASAKELEKQAQRKAKTKAQALKKVHAKAKGDPDWAALVEALEIPTP